MAQLSVVFVVESGLLKDPSFGCSSHEAKVFVEYYVAGNDNLSRAQFVK